MEKLSEIFAGLSDIIVVFHKRKPEEINLKDPDNYFYVLYKKHPSCGDLQACNSEIHKVMGGSVLAKSINDMDLIEKDEVFLKYHAVYNPDPAVTQEYVTRTLKAHAAYKEAAAKSLESYKGVYKDEDAFEIYYLIPAIPLALSVIAFLVVLVKKQDTQWIFFFGMWVVIFLAVYLVVKVSKVFDKVLPMLFSGSSMNSENSDYAEARQHIAAGSPEKALKKYRKLVAKYPEKFEPNYQLAQLLEQTGAYRESLMEYQKAFMKEFREETLSTVLFHMSEICVEKLGDKQSAKKYLQRLLEEFPESKMAPKAKALLETQEKL